MRRQHETRPQCRPSWTTDKSVSTFFLEGRLRPIEQLSEWSSSRHTVLVGLDVEGVNTTFDDKLVHISVGFAIRITTPAHKRF